jgi:predicted AlkP superfamily phosphohydrolase/phosphomutase
VLAKRAAVIGLDAADFGFLDPWMAAGDLPRLRALRDGGAWGTLASTFPPVSAPAWSTFMTGLRPERHGLFDFVMEDPATGRRTLARADLVRGRKLWEAAGDAGRRSVVINVPITWPPSPFPGVLVTGMLTPEGKAFTHPPELGASILAEFPGYRTDFDAGLLPDMEALRAQLDGMALQGSRLMRALMAREAWDLFVGVFTTTDRVKHQFWDRRETVVREHYRAVDRYVGELAADAGPGTLLLVLSDHGFRSVPAKFYPNRWLRERGLLGTRTRRGAAPAAPAPEEREEEEHIRAVEEFLAPERPEGGVLPRLRGMLGLGGALEVDPSRTRASLYSIETGGIQVNLKGRAPGGIVEPGREYEEVRDRVIEGLRELRFPGTDEPLFDLVERREAVYRGPMAGWAPDVVTRSKGNRVAIAKDLDPGRWLRAQRHERGGHSPDGILLASGPGVRKGVRLEGLAIEDVAPTLLWALGIPVPADLDGRVRTELFEEEAVRANPVVRGAPSAPAAAPPPGGEFSAAEEEELRKTLEGLGYI